MLKGENSDMRHSSCLKAPNAFQALVAYWQRLFTKRFNSVLLRQVWSQHFNRKKMNKKHYTTFHSSLLHMRSYFYRITVMFFVFNHMRRRCCRCRQMGCESLAWHDLDYFMYSKCNEINQYLLGALRSEECFSCSLSALGIFSDGNNQDNAPFVSSVERKPVLSYDVVSCCWLIPRLHRGHSWTCLWPCCRWLVCVIHF